MPRPYWSGTIQISLVGFAVEIYPATNSTRPITFHEIDRNTMNRVHRQNVSAGAAPAASDGDDADDAGMDDSEEEPVSAKHKTSLHIAPKASHAPASAAAAASALASALARNDNAGATHEVQKADIVKGYEYEKGKYAIVEPAELKNLRLAGKKTVEISQFAHAAEINSALFEKPYFVIPKAGPQATAFGVVRQGMMESGMMAIGEIVFSGRQRLVAIGPPHDPDQPCMMLYTLRFSTELRDVRDYTKGVEMPHADAAQLKLARQLIEAYTQPFDLAKYKDHYEDALRELVEAKIHNQPLPAAEPERKPGKVIDLMEALRRSLAQHKPAGSEPEPAAEPDFALSPEPAAGKPPRRASGAGASRAKSTSAKSAKKPKSA